MTSHAGFRQAISSVLRWFVVFAASSGAAWARDESQRAEQPPPHLLPVAQATRTPSPPVIDGDSSDDVWNTAVEIGRLFQVEPRPGEPASEDNVIRVLYHSDAVYFSIPCLDNEPGLVVATQMARNGDTFLDDRITILIDTFHDRRNGYEFAISAAGAREDSLIADNGTVTNENWDGIWRGRARLSPEGWEAEVAIPFQTVGFRPDDPTWGFNVQRLIRRKVEFARWASPSPDFDFEQVAQAGTLTGLEGMRQGLG